jgi:hypothetical protein
MQFMHKNGERRSICVYRAVIRRWLRGKPIFGADEHHLHHRMQRCTCGVLVATAADRGHRPAPT